MGSFLIKDQIKDLTQFFDELGAKVERRNSKPSNLERSFKRIRDEFSSNLPDLGLLFPAKNRIIGLGYSGERTSIRGRFTCNLPENVFLGDDVFVNYDCMFISDDLILIDSNVLMGPRVGIFTSNHYLNEKRNFELETAPVSIRRNSWIGAYSVILPGVNISEGTQIGAGSVVIKSTEPYGLYVGNPAKRVKDLQET